MELKNLFVSFSNNDRVWAEWLAWQLEEVGYTVNLHPWDFRTGKYRMFEMHQEIAEAQGVILLLSPDYLEIVSSYPEWAAAFKKDNVYIPEKLLMVQIRACNAKTLTGESDTLNLVGVEAQNALGMLFEKLAEKQMRPGNPPRLMDHHFRRIKEKPLFPSALPAVWNMLMNRNPDFMGREEVLGQLNEALNSGLWTALIPAEDGLEGIGKTQIALEYVYQYQHNYQMVWWIRAENEVVMASDYAALAEAIGLPEKYLVEQEKNIAAVREWLEQHEGWLLIFDNARYPEDIQPYLPQTETGHVLVTSGNMLWGQVMHALTIQGWSREESIAFLKSRTPREQPEVMDVLAKTLKDFPLALEQAAAYVNAADTSLDDYLKKLLLLKESGRNTRKSAVEYSEIMALTSRLAIEQLEKIAPINGYLLNLFAYLAPDEIPAFLFENLVEILPEEIAWEAGDMLSVDKRLRMLKKYALISASYRNLSIHRSVQAVIRERLAISPENQGKWIKAAVKLIGRNCPDDTLELKTKVQCSDLLANAWAVLEHTRDCKLDSADNAYLLVQVGRYLSSIAAYQQSEMLLRSAIEIYERCYGGEHSAFADSLNHLAKVLRCQLKYRQAEELYRRSLKIYEKMLGSEHPEIAGNLNHLAGFLWELGKYSETEPLYRRMLQIYEAQMGPQHPSVALSLNNLAESLRAQGKYQEAEPVQRRLLGVREALLEPFHPDLADSLNNLAGTLYALGKCREAEIFQRRSLDIYQQVLGDGHPDTIAVRKNLEILLTEIADPGDSNYL